MDRKIILSVLSAALMGFIGIWLLLTILPDERAGLRLYPWDASRDAAGNTRVFDLSVGESTLDDVRTLLGEEGKINLFENPDGTRTVEVYFDNIFLSNLRADWIITLDVPETDLAGMFERGLRISKAGSGSRKVKLDPADVEQLRFAPLRILTYLPWKSLEPQDVNGNFGEPTEQRTEESGVVHWLYPDQGMDIARDRDGGVVIQYMNREDFDRAVAMLPEPNTAPEPSSLEASSPEITLPEDKAPADADRAATPAPIERPAESDVPTVPVGS
jgi:hypothetical protein